MAKTSQPTDPLKIPNAKKEAKQIQELAQLMVTLLDKRYTAKKKPVLRGVHPKSHGCVKAIFEVRHDIDKELQQGLFKTPGRRFEALIRYSNAAAVLGPDISKEGKHGSRGMAIKVLDVDGRVLLDDDGQKNQDFLMINSPAFAFANVKDYLRLNQILLKFNDKADAFFAPLDPRLPPVEGLTANDIKRIAATFAIASKSRATPVANPLEIQYFGAAPFLFGKDHVMRFAAQPWGGEKPQIPPNKPSATYLRKAVTKTMRGKDPICFDFMIQVRRVDEKGLNIEDATKHWDDEKFPFVNVATIVIPAPQMEIDSRKAEAECERLVFTPWHSLAAHKPLGGINRLRKAIYIASAEHRGGCAEAPSRYRAKVKRTRRALRRR